MQRIIHTSFASGSFLACILQGNKGVAPFKPKTDWHENLRVELISCYTQELNL